MRRLVAGLTILLFFVLPMPPVKAEGTTTVWGTDQAINDSVMFETGTALRIEAGVTVTFPLPSGGPSAEVPSLFINGSLELNSTASSPVNFIGYVCPTKYYYPAWMVLGASEGDRPFRIHDATFRNLKIMLGDTSAVFDNCTFDYCAVSQWNSTVSMRYCTFQASGATSPVSASASVLDIRDCTFDGTGGGPDGLPVWPQYCLIQGAIGCVGQTSVKNCTISNYTNGVRMDSGAGSISGCRIFSCKYSGIDDNAGVWDIDDCTLWDCSEGIWVGATANITNCTIYGSSVGIHAQDYHMADSDQYPLQEPYWHFSGNRFFNNSYDIILMGQDAELDDNIFPQNNGSLREIGRVLQELQLYINMTDPLGQPVPDFVENGTGEHGMSIWYPLRSQFVVRQFHEHWLYSYLIDDNGTRTDYYPYLVYADSEGLRSANATVTRGTNIITLVLPWSNDLFPANLTPVPKGLREGRMVQFSVEIHNRGLRSLANVSATLYIDGVAYDRTVNASIPANFTLASRSISWKATTGHHVVEVRVDPDNVINEYNETNNVIQVDFNVSETPPSTTVAGALCLPAGAVLIVVFAAGAGFWFWRRRAE